MRFVSPASAWLVGCSIVCCASGAVRAAVVEFQERATVDPAGVIRLGDVARISEADPTRRAQLEDLTLAPSPPAGRTTRLTYDDIRQRVLAQGVNLTELEFRGRSQVLVTTADIVPAVATEAPPPKPLPPALVMPVPPAPLKPVAKPTPSVSENEQRRAREILAAAFEREFRPTGTNAAPLKFRCECPRMDVRRVLSAPIGQIRFEQAQLVAGGPQPLIAWWTASDGEREAVLLQAWVQQTPQVLGVKHALPKGHVLQTADLTGIPAKDDAAGLTRLGDVIGKETTRALRPGQPLQPGDMTAVPLVRSNDIVTVLVRRPGLVVRRQFKATSSGALQETITLVALDDSRTKVQAVVTGYHEATIVSPDSEPPSALQNDAAVSFAPASVREGAP